MSRLKGSALPALIARADAGPWTDGEVAGSEFKDERLGKRFCILLEQLADGVGPGIPLACQDWANTKAANHMAFGNESPGEYARKSRNLADRPSAKGAED